MNLPTLTDIERLIAQAQPQATPYFIFDTQGLRDVCRQFKSAFPAADIFFAVKANNDPAVLKVFHQEGIHFDVASWGEINLLSTLGVPPEHMIFSSPTKIPADIERAYAFGIRTYAFDSSIELQKLERLAPGSNVNLRLIVDNQGSDWPLERKFGVLPEQAPALLAEARQRGLVPWGLCFHVGSQNSSPEAWDKALELAAGVYHAAQQQHGITLQAIDTGGGFPVQYHKPIPDLPAIAAVVNQAHRRLFAGQPRLVLEPGRGLVGGSGVLVTRVINRARRGECEWLHLDAGVFHGLFEAMQGFRYPVLARRSAAELIPFVICGPTCDSADVIMEHVMLPADLTLGDELYLLSTGAYSVSMEHYNGIPFPPAVLL